MINFPAVNSFQLMSIRFSKRHCNGRDRLVNALQSIESSPVYNRDGERLGTIDHMMLDRNFGRQYAVLRFSTPLGIGERYYPMPLTKLAYDARLNGYVAGIDVSRLREGAELQQRQ